MPGNEVVDKVHNFFEQDCLSLGEHQSQVGSGNWPVLNNNLWVGNQRQIGIPLSSSVNNYNVQQSDSERKNGSQSAQMPLGANLTQLTLRPEFAKTQSRNQHQNLNGFMHGHQDFQTRQYQGGFLEENSVSDRHNLTSRGLSVHESHLGNAPEHRPTLTINSQRLETAEAPINFDFLGSQQQLTRGPQSGMPQPQPRQQSGYNDMQALQQHFMFKQLQELQKQQQLQQLDEARPQNSMNQLSVIAKQAADDQLPSLINGTPIHDTSNYLWSGQLMGSESKVPSTSQMFMAGNMNWMQHGGSCVQGFPNGHMLSQEQDQVLHSMGLVSQQLDQSLYGAPIANMKGTLNQYSHLQGISHDSVDMLTKASGNQVEKPLMQSSAFNNSFQGDQCAVLQNQVLQDGSLVSKQGFQGRNMLGHVPIQGFSIGALSGNLQQENSLTRNAPFQEFHGRQEQGGWSGSLQEKTATQVGLSQGLVTLDPTEEKILFSTNDGVWDASFGRSSNMGIGGFVNPLEGQDYLNVFPSIQSGSWSALMQSAVAEASSSDTGLQDEWSGLSFQKTELSTGNQPATFSDIGKQQTNWVDSNVQSASSLTPRPFPLLHEANMSPSCHNVPGFQQSDVKFSHGQSDRVQPDTSHESIQQSPKEVRKWLDRSPPQRPLIEGSQQVQPHMHLENASEGAWTSQVYEHSESATHSADMELNAQNMQDSWTRQRSVSAYNTGNQPCNKSSGWSINESLSPSGDVALKIRENENTVQHSQNNDYSGPTHMEKNRDGDMWRADSNNVAIPFPNSTGGLSQVKSGTSSPQVNREGLHMSNLTALPNSGTTKINQENNQQIPSSHQVDYGKYNIDSSAKLKGNGNVGKYQHQLSKGSRVVASSMNKTERDSHETYDHKQESYHQKDISNDSYNSNQSQHIATGGGLRENVWLSANDSRPSAGANRKSSGQTGRKASGPRRFQYHPMGNLEVNVEPADTAKHVSHSQALSQQVARGLKSHEQGYFGQSKFVANVPNNATHVEKGHLPNLRRNTNGSEGPSRVGIQGYESNISASFDGSTGINAQNRTAQTGQNMLELLHKVDQSREHSSVTNYGASGCIPSSEMSGAEASDASASHLQHNQASQGFGLRLAPPSQQPVSNNLSSQNSLQTVHDLNSGRVKPEIGEKGQTCLTPMASVQSLPYEMSQRAHWDNTSKISGQKGNETTNSNFQGNSATLSSPFSYSRDELQNQHMSSASGQVTNQAANASFDRLSSHFRQSNDSFDRVIADQSAQTSLPGSASRIPPFNLAYPADTSQPTTSSSSYLRVSSQLPVLEALPISQPSATSGISQQGAFSTMLHNVWTNVSTQQRLTSGQLNKASPNLFQSINPSSNNLETTSWAPQKPDDLDVKKGGNGPSEFDTCYINSQHFAYGEKQSGKEGTSRQISSDKVDLAPQTVDESQGKETMTRHLLDGNSVASASLMARSHQQDLDRGRLGKDLTLVSQTEHVSHPNPAASNKDIGTVGRALKSSHALHHNYSLLHQVQLLKNAESDPSKRGVKKFKGADCVPDAQQIPAKVGQQLLHGYSAVDRDAVDNELNTAVCHISFPSGEKTKMLSFLSEAREDQTTGASSQLVFGDIPSQKMATLSQNDSSDIGLTSVRTDHCQIRPQKPSLLDSAYGTFRNGQMVPMYATQKNAMTAAHQFLFGKPSESLHTHPSTEQVKVVDANEVGSVWQSTTTTLVASEHLSPLHSLPPNITDQSLVIERPKKRKREKLLPWHKVMTQGSQTFQSISMAELDWAQSTNRLIEKVEDEAEMVEEGQSLLRPRRRFVLTTQLLQQLLRPPQAIILSAEATSDYESVTYSVAKLALGDACSLISCSGSDSHVPSDNGNTTSERTGHQYFSKVVEDFIGRARKLENDLLRLDKRASILDIRIECQDQERYSVMNRFGKFHGRGHADGAETSSSSEAAGTSQKTLPRRYVAVFSMPRNLPEGVQCLSL